MDNYEEERGYVPALPEIYEIPDLHYFVNNGMGVAAFSEGEMVGFIGSCEPFEGAFDAFDSLGTFSPMHAHGAIKENRKLIYQRLIQEATDIWSKRNIVGYGIALYAHDKEAKEAFFEYGYGMRCMDQIRPLETISEIQNSDIVFEELPLIDFPKLRSLRQALDNHLKLSPCYMQSTREEFLAWVTKVEKGDRRTFVAKDGDGIIAYMDIAEEGETFITKRPEMVNILGAYCSPEYRGRGIYRDLLEFVIRKMQAEGFTLLGVDHESYNPTALNFWSKYFTQYTNSVVRKIETWANEQNPV